MLCALRLLAFAAAAALSSAALADDRVLVIPFNTLNVPAAQQWIGKGVAENLVADLGRTGDYIPIAFGGQVIVEDNTTASRLARSLNAPFAIRGSVQVVGDNLRLTAQVIDSRSGDTVRTALVTGTAPDLLKMEDELANQIRGTATAATTATGPTAPYIPIIAPQPQVIVISQPQPYYPTYYPNYYGNYPYCFNYGFPLVLYQVNTGHGRDRDGRDGRDGRGDHNRGPGGGGLIVHGGSSPNSLPLPTSTVLPIPTSLQLPIPTHAVLPLPTINMSPVITHLVPPLPTNNVAPVPTMAPAVPQNNPGRGRSPRSVN